MDFDDKKLIEMSAHVAELHAGGKTPDEIKQALREKYAAAANEDDPTWAVPTTIVPVVVA
jgi:hypothetical protein